MSKEIQEKVNSVIGIETDTKVLSAATKVASRIKSHEKAVGDLADAILASEASKEFKTVKSIRRLFDNLMTACGLLREELESSSDKDRYDYFKRVTVRLVAEGIGLETKKTEQKTFQDYIQTVVAARLAKEMKANSTPHLTALNNAVEAYLGAIAD